MKIIKDIQELKNILKDENKTVGFVPTMGALHKGHLSLIERSVDENELTVVSIFVNPTQFLKGEDLDKYPRKEEADLKICKFADVDIVFLPTKEMMYGENEISILAPNTKGYILEGTTRPGHFDGVLQVVCKLFHIVNPTRAYFGKKDAQQLYLIKKMTKDLFMDVKIIECDLLRDVDGLALSSRNVYLENEQRQIALAIPRSLKKAAKKISAGMLNSHEIKQTMLESLQDVDVEYIAIVDRDFNEIDEIIVKNSIILIAARVGSIRLIDNIWI